jgi:hypothetical protein
MQPPPANDPAPTRRLVPLIGVLHVDEDRFEPYAVVQLIPSAESLVHGPEEP